MYISRLALDHFRSWGQLVVDFTPGINILYGANGLGKTNIVEAIEVLSTGSSHRVSSSLPLVERGERKATVRANVSEGDVTASSETVGTISDEDGKASEVRSVNDALRTGDSNPAVNAGVVENSFENPREPAVGAAGTNEGITTYEVSIAAHGANRGRINNGHALYMRDIVGKVPSVSFAPDDQGLVSGDPGARRGFLDQAAALLDPRYATVCAEFNKIAKQRVALLKQLGAQQESVDARQMALSGLEVWTGQFIESGVRLTRARSELVTRLAHRFNGIYERLSGGDQQAGLSYEPSFEEVLQFERPESEISKHFERLYAGEVSRGRNLIGPHRDDLIISLEGVPAKEFASNGEMWTLALALKMALYDEVSSISGNKPIIILDDVFAQLDDMRRSRILDFALAQDQVVLTVAALGDVPARVMNEDAVNVVDVARLKAAAVDANEALVAELRNTMFGAVDGNAAETVRDQASDLKARTTSGGRSLGGGAAGMDFELTENSSGTVGEIQSDGADGMEGARPNIDGESAERSTGDGAE